MREICIKPCHYSSFLSSSTFY